MFRCNMLMGTMLVIIVLVSGVNISRGDNATDEPLPLTPIADLMATAREDIQSPRRVRIRGTISVIADGIATPARGKDDRTPASFCMEQDFAGIWVQSFHAVSQGLFQSDLTIFSELEYGVDIELEGWFTQGGFAPSVMPVEIKILGRSELPEPPPLKMRRFMNGGEDPRRVTVSGVVQNIIDQSNQRRLIRVETGVGHFVVKLPKTEQFSPQLLLDAEIQVTGVVVASRNWRSEFVCPRLIVASSEHLSIIKPAPTDPFSVKSARTESIDWYSPNGRPHHRRRVQGVVTYSDGKKKLYIQDAGTGIHVRTSRRAKVEVGDRVEVAGFIDTSDYFAGLRGALVRRLSKGQAPQPIAVTMKQIIQDHLAMREQPASTIRSRDGSLVQMSGRLLSFHRGSPPYPHRIELDCGDATTSAFLSGEIEELEPGMQVQVTGVADFTYALNDESSNLAAPVRVDLLCRDASDIVIVARPQWTVRRVFTALLFVVGLAFAAFVWAFIMRRALARQTDRLAAEMRNRRDAAIEFQGAVTERARLAANLHDTLLQTMAGIAYQLEACSLHQSEPSKVAGANQNGHPNRSLETARRMVQRGQDDLRNTVWALHSLPMDEGTFADSVRQVARKINAEYARKVDVKCDDNLPDLADFIAGNLLLVIQEAIHNAIKHSGSETIEICVLNTPDREGIRLVIQDHGQGFDTNARPRSLDGHFGIESMQQRVERLGGTCVIESQPGEGTTVSIEIPLKEFDTRIAKVAF